MLLDGILANVDVFYLHLLTLFARPDMRLNGAMGGYTNFYFKRQLVLFGGPEGSTIYRVSLDSDGKVKLYMRGGIEYGTTPLYVEGAFKQHFHQSIENILL